MYTSKVNEIDKSLDNCFKIAINESCGKIQEKFAHDNDSYYGPGRIVLKIDGEGELVIYTDFGRDITYGLLYYLVNRERP